MALLEHRGVPHMPGETIRRFIGWRRRNGLSLQIGAMFNLLHGDPAEASPAPYYLCAALETSRPMKRALSAL